MANCKKSGEQKKEPRNNKKPKIMSNVSMYVFIITRYHRTFDSVIFYLSENIDKKLLEMSSFLL